DIYGLDAVLLSHLHPDHFFDLASLYVARRYHPGGSPPQLPVYGPAGTELRLAQAYGHGSAGFAEVFSFHAWADNAAFEVGPFRVTVRLVAHPVEAYSMRIEHDGRSLVYTGDTGATEALVDLARGADVLLSEASFVETDPNPPDLHLTGHEAADHAVRAGVGR